MAEKAIALREALQRQRMVAMLRAWKQQTQWRASHADRIMAQLYLMRVEDTMEVGSHIPQLPHPETNIKDILPLLVVFLQVLMSGG